MSSFYDLASLVMIPSGKKAGKVYSQKPLTTDGQLDFTRASTATRIGSDGNIEKTRTNLLLQSNQFNTTWTLSEASVTSGQSGYDGTNNAWLLNVTSGTGGQRLYQSIVSSGVTTYSVYLKAGTTDWVALRLTGSPTNFLVWFNLSNGTKGTNQNAIDYTITSVGSGWYRCTLTANTTSDFLFIYPATNDDLAGLNCVSGDNIYIQDVQLEQGLVATDYIPTTSAAVSVGSVDNMPRLNYTPGSATSCPSLLLEPQRTNVVTHSEYFEASDWNKNSSTVLSNQITSPENTNNASKLSDASAFDRHSVWRNYTTSSTNNTISIFAKKGTKKHFSIYTSDTTTWNTMLVVDLEAGTITKEYNKIGFTSINTIESYANGWYRIVAAISGTQSGNALYTRFAIQDEAEPANPPNNKYTGDGTGNVYIYGAQVELGASYATSYIPTFGATVTRTTDNCEKSGISSLLGQTEGTVFFEYTVSSDDTTTFSRILNLRNTSSSEQIYLQQDADNTLKSVVYNGSNQFIGNTTSGFATKGTTYKIALAYKDSDYAFYIDGVSIETSTASGLGTLSISFIDFDTNLITASNQCKKLLVFKTRLSNTQLAELTSLDS